MSDIRVCQVDGEPLVFTFDYPGHEYVCVVCRDLEGIFGERRPATPALAARLNELTEHYERWRAEQRGQVYRAPQCVGEPGIVAPTCGACGAQPESGTPLVGGKPRHWFSRTRDGATQFACSRSCIPANEMVLPW